METKRLFIGIWMLFMMHHASAQKMSVHITGATLHIGNGNVINNGELEIKDGKILYAGNLRSIPISTSDVTKQIKIIEAKGKHVYPGLFCLNTTMGLNEIDAVRATLDMAETGILNPNARALIAYNTDSKVLPTALFNGIVFVQPTPVGGIISGQSSIMYSKGWNWEDAQVKADDGIHLNWPELNPWGDVTKQTERMQREQKMLDDFFAQAKQYCTELKPVETNLRFEAMRGLFAGAKRLYIHVNAEEGIIRAVQFVRQYKIKYPVLVGAEHAIDVAQFLREENIPVILNLTHKLPAQAHHDVSLPYKMPALLKEAGVKVALGNSGAWESRNVMFQAGTTAAYGLNKEEALQLITKNAAEIAGVGESCGTLEKGKMASFIICDGDILDMRTNNMDKVFIGGEEVEFNAQQQALFKKYKDKYGF